MAVQLSAGVRNAELDAIETTISTAPVLRIYTGSAPTNTASSATGTQIVTMTLPSDWMAAASGGTKAKSGTWSGTAGNGGTVGYFRVWDSSVTTCHIQGTVTDTSGGGDMTVDDASVTSGQTVTVTTFTLTAANS